MDDGAAVAPAPDDDAAAAGSAGSSRMLLVVRGLAQVEGRGAKAVRRRRRPTSCNTRRRLQAIDTQIELARGDGPELMVQQDIPARRCSDI